MNQLRLVLPFALAVVGTLASCSSAGSTDSADVSVLQVVIADQHFLEWTQCGDAQYVLHPVSGPPAYENEKPFFFTSTEMGRGSPDRLSPEVLESLRQANASERPLPGLPKGKLPAPEPQGGRRVWLSFPGYDSTGSFAAVAVTRNSVGDCAAAGYIVMLRRVGENWIVEDRPTEWVE